VGPTTLEYWNIGSICRLRPVVVAAAIVATCLNMAFLRVSLQSHGSPHGMAIQEEKTALKPPSRLYLFAAERRDCLRVESWSLGVLEWELWRCGVELSGPLMKSWLRTHQHGEIVVGDRGKQHSLSLVLTCHRDRAEHLSTSPPQN
jgi:hypothetical protein